VSQLASTVYRAAAEMTSWRQFTPPQVLPRRDLTNILDGGNGDDILVADCTARGLDRLLATNLLKVVMAMTVLLLA
jgi:hypothetical protein